jgi:hypothetical protein
LGKLSDKRARLSGREREKYPNREFSDENKKKKDSSRTAVAA